MFFTSLIVFGVCVAFLPWYAVAVAALILGAAIPRGIAAHFSAAAAAGIVSAALAFGADGRLHGVVSVRMAGLLSLPQPALVFWVMFMLAFITAFLWLRAGVFLRQIFLPGKT